MSYFKYDDGGRKASGARGERRDCVVRAIAIVTEQPYQAVVEGLEPFIAKERLGKRKRRISNPYNGVYTATTHRYMASIGWHWVSTMGIGTGCTVHLKAEELPPGRLLVRLTRHLTAVIDGVIHDTGDPSRGGTRCVYGYWTKTPELKPDSGLRITFRNIEKLLSLR